MKVMFHISCRPLRRILSTTSSSSSQSQRRLSTTSKTTSTTIISDYTPYLSEVSLARQPSAIRKLMPLTKQLGMVSLGGGMPNPTLFPFQSFEMTIEMPQQSTIPSETNGNDNNNYKKKLILEGDELQEALQYSPTPGLPRLRQQLMELQRRNHGSKGDNACWDVTVTCGSQDGLCKAFEMLLNPQRDDTLFLENPTYSGALAFLHPFGVKLTPVATDEYGMIPEALTDALELESSSRKQSRHRRRRRKVLYTIPTAQNPSGSTLPNSRREHIYQIAQRHDMIILEDDPYYFLHPNRSNLTSFLQLDIDGRVIRFDSLSKLISSGIRIGWATANSKLLERFNYHIQATNLHNSGISQLLVQKLLDEWNIDGLDQHVQKVAEFYVERGQVLAHAAERHLKGLAKWNIPEAGMFLWFQLLGIDDTKTLIETKAAEANVLLVPGQAFSPLNQPSSYARASFSTASNEEMDLAMERLAKLIQSEKK